MQGQVKLFRNQLISKTAKTKKDFDLRKIRQIVDRKFSDTIFSLFVSTCFFSVALIALITFRGKKVRGKHALASQVIRKLKVSQGYAALTG